MREREISNILLDTMDPFDSWKTPSVGSLKIERSGDKISGSFKSSLSEYYYQEDRFFEIKGNVCRVWSDQRTNLPPAWEYDFKQKNHLNQLVA